MRYRYSRFLPAFNFGCDLLFLNGCLLQVPESGLRFAVLNACWIVLSLVFKTYKVSRPVMYRALASKSVQATASLFLISVSLHYRQGTTHQQLLHLAELITLFLVECLAYRYLLAKALEYIRKRGYNSRNVLVIGDGQMAVRLKEHFQNHPEYGYDLVPEIFSEDIMSWPEPEIYERLNQNQPAEIFLCLKHPADQLTEIIIRFGAAYGIQIKIVSDLIMTTKFSQLIKYYSLPALHSRGTRQLGGHVVVTKRLFDVVFSASVLTLASPVFLVLYIITRTTSRGPAFYRQERVGLDGTPFHILKFRSMTANAENAVPQLSSDGDPRVTQWGRVMRKTRLDELPQFWNVLKGDMSMVGPRPERRYFIDKIEDRKPRYRRLLSIKPGITSIGQVHYGYAENVDQMCERMEYDLLYLENINLRADVHLILKTLRVMIRREGK